MALKSKNNKQRANRKVCNHERNSAGIANHLALDPRRVSAFIESFQSNPRELNRYARIRTWGFAGTDIGNAIKFEAAQFARMNRSSVVSTRSLRRPGVNSLGADFDIHRVHGMNFVNEVPTNCDFLMGVSDFYTLVKKSNFRDQKNQARKLSDQDCPSYRSDFVMYRGARTEKTRSGHAEAERINTDRHKNITSRSIDLRVAHLAMFSRKAA